MQKVVCLKIGVIKSGSSFSQNITGKNFSALWDG
jgi:hypothetical protein